MLQLRFQYIRSPYHDNGYSYYRKKGWGCQSVKGVCLGKNGTIVIVSFAETPY